MPQFEYAVDGTNLETYFPYVPGYSYPPHMGYVSTGSTLTRTLDGTLRTDGARVCELEVGGAWFTHLDAYVTAVFGGWSDQSSVAVTLRAKELDGTYANFSAMADFPILNEDYQMHHSGQVRNLKLRFYIVG